MAGITSLIVKIGAQDAEVTAALEKLGSNVKRTESELKKLGTSPIAQQAQQSLKTLDETMKQIQTSQQRLADRARIAAAGLDSMGGPARLTNRELEQVNRTLQQGLDAYRALGQQAPEELQKVADAVSKQRKELQGGGGAAGSGAFGQVSSLLGTIGIGGGALTAAGIVGTVSSLASSALDAADNLTKLADKTGITIEGLQRLQAVAEPSGNSLDQVSSAVTQMQKRIAEGADGTSEALGAIGLSIDDLRALSPDEQFFAIAKGIQSIKDPAQQVKIAMDLFGKSGAEILPTLKADVDSLKDSTIKMSAESARSLDDLGDAFARWKGNAVSSIGEVIGQLLQLEQASRGALSGGILTLLTPGFGGRVVGNRIGDRAGRAVEQALSGPTNLPSIAQRTQDRALGPQPGAFALGVSATQAQVELERGLADQLKRASAAATAAANADRDRARALRDAEKATEAMTIKTASLVAITERRLRAGGVTLTEQLDALPETPSRRVGSALFGDLQAGRNPQLAAASQSFGRGLSEVLRTSLPQSILAAVQGGGSVVSAAGSTLGSFLTSEKGIGKTLTSGLTKALGDGLGGAAAALLPGIGSLLGPLLGAIANRLKEAFGGPSQQELAGRDAQAAFQNRFRSFDDMVNAVGDAFAATGRSREDAQAAVQAMLNAERQGAEAVRAEIERLQGVLDQADRVRQGASQFGLSQSELNTAATDARQVYDYMVRLQEQGEYTQDQVNAAYLAWQRAMGAAGNEAARAWVEAHDAASTGLTEPVTQIQSQIAQLRQSIANEAPEAVKGVIETQVEGQIAALDSQMRAQQNQLAAHAEETATDATAAIGRVFDDFQAHVEVVYDYPEGGPVGGALPNPVPLSRGGRVVPGGAQYFDTGGRVLPFLPRGTDTVPAMLTPGEIVLTAAQQGNVAAALSAGLGGGGSTTVILEVDSRTLADMVVPHVPGVLKRYRIA